MTPADQRELAAVLEQLMAYARNVGSRSLEAELEKIVRLAGVKLSAERIDVLRTSR